jgi:hypothetical protein
MKWGGVLRKYPLPLGKYPCDGKFLPPCSFEWYFLPCEEFTIYYAPGRIPRLDFSEPGFQIPKNKWVELQIPPSPGSKKTEYFYRYG